MLSCPLTKQSYPVAFGEHYGEFGAIDLVVRKDALQRGVPVPMAVSSAIPVVPGLGCPFSEQI